MRGKRVVFKILEEVVAEEVRETVGGFEENRENIRELRNTIKRVGKILGFFSGGRIEYDKFRLLLVS